MPPARQKGQVYLGLVISLGILSILSGVVIALVLTAYRIVSFTASRTNAKHVATEYMEVIRNLPYDDVGTVGGLPPGVIPQVQTSQRNGLQYTISTTVIYIDDPFDSLSPDDLLASDYKRIRVSVEWEGVGGGSANNPVILISDLAPRGVETTTGGGTLSILVFDSEGEPVPQANIHVVATSINPPVDANYLSADNGRFILPGVPACDSCYEITVTKNSFSTDRTYSSTEVTNPIKPHQTVIAESLTEISFTIDTLSTLIISGPASQEFQLQGNKIIGTNALDEPIYKYLETHNTGSSGSITLADVEWDSYTFTHTSPIYDLAGLNPLSPFEVLPGTQSEVSFLLEPHTQSSLRVIFTDQADNLIASVAAQLKDNGEVIASSSSGLEGEANFGQVFFANLTNKIYQLEATVSGFLNFTGNLEVNDQSTEPVILTSQ